MFLGMISLSVAQVFLILLTWYSFYPSTGSNAEQDDHSASGVARGGEDSYSQLDEEEAIQ